MIACGTTIFADSDDYRASVPGALIDFVPLGGVPARSRVTWINMQHLTLIGVEESMPRVSFVNLRPDAVFVSFPLRSEPPQLWNGLRIRRGAIIRHGVGDCFHHRMAGRGHWGMISLTSADLAAFGRTLLGIELAPPSMAKFHRPPPPIARDILRLHSEACRIVENRSDLIRRPEVSRALEQELIYALITGLSSGESNGRAGDRQRGSDIMARFQRVLDMIGSRRVSAAELSDAVGVSQRMLRMYCMEFLGIGPVSYARLRRLSLVRSALMGDASATATVAALARDHGFLKPERFAAAYRAAFGELPSTTLRRKQRSISLPQKVDSA
jgi:AraC family ethanolamine operon transcriptional activator